MGTDILSERFLGGIERKGLLEARISIFSAVRNIPYAVIPEIVHPQKYLEILEVNKGSCSPKHFLLADLLERLGLTVFYSVWEFHWKDIPVEWPLELERLARDLPANTHLALRVRIDDKFVLVDATLDPQLASLGLPINEWDGKTDTLLPIQPLGGETWYSPDERKLIIPDFSEKSLLFYEKLNLWLEQVRKTAHV